MSDKDNICLGLLELYKFNQMGLSSCPVVSPCVLRRWDFRRGGAEVVLGIYPRWKRKLFCAGGSLFVALARRVE